MAADPWLSSPLDVVLKDAGTLLGQEDTMLPTAFRLLDRLKMPCPGDDAGGCSRLLRLIGRYVGYHPAVVEQVLEALSLSEHPAAIIEVLPLLVVGAGSKEVTRVAESLQAALNEDLTGLLLPVLAALFDLPLPAKLRREALQLARDSLAVVEDQDVPLVVRTILKTLDESSDPSIVSDIRRECANLSPSSLAVLMEVLSTALATNPRATRLLLMSLRMATTDSLLSTVDVLVLLLLFPRSSSASASTNGGVTDLVLRCVSCHALPFPVLLRLVDYTSDAHWAVLTTPLLELCKWLLLAPLTASSPPRGSGSRLVLLPDALAEASGWAARLLQRLYELHASSRDHILGFLLSLCINAALRKAYSTGAEEEGDEEAGQRRQRAACLTQVMARASGVVSSLARQSPQLLLPYTGMLCDQLLNSASELEPCVMSPLLQALTRLGRAQSGSGLGMTLMIYIQKQLWATIPQPAGLLRHDHDASGAAERRRLASLILAEALVSGGRDKRGEEEEEEEDLPAIVTWVLRCVPTASPMVASQGLGFLTRLLRRSRRSGRGGLTTKQVGRVGGRSTRAVARPWPEGKSDCLSLPTTRRGGEDEGDVRVRWATDQPAMVMTWQVVEVTRCLNGLMGLLLPLIRLPPRDARRLSYTTSSHAALPVAVEPLQPRPRPKDPGKSRMATTSSSMAATAALPSSAVGELLWPGERGPLVWAVERAVDELLPGLLAGAGSSSSQLSVGGAVAMVRGVVETALELMGAHEDPSRREQVPAWVREVGQAAMLMPRWRGRGDEGWQVDDAGCQSVEEEDDEGDKENDSAAVRRRKTSPGKAQDDEEEEEELELDVFRSSGGAGCGRERVMRAGWSAAMGVVVVSSLVRAVYRLQQKSDGGGGSAAPKGVLLELLERLVDLMQRAKACLCKLDEWSRKGTSSKKGSSSKAAQQRRRGKATSAAHAEEPARVRRGRLLLRRALEDELPGCVTEAMTGGLLDQLLQWLEDRLSTHHDEEQEEEEGGVGVPVAMLAVVLDQIRRTRSRAGQGGAGLLDDTRGLDHDTDEASGPTVLQDDEVGHVCRLLRLLRPLNDLASSLRKKRARTGSSSVSAWQVVSLLELCLSHIQHALLQARRHDRALAMQHSMGPTHTQAAAGSSSSSQQAPSTPTSSASRLLGLSGLASKCAQALRHTPTTQQPPASSASDLEEVFLYLATLAQATDSDAVASGVVEVLSCLTVHTQRAETGTCWQALACLTAAYPLTSHKSEHCPSLPVALSSLLQSSLGVHETPSRRLWDLYKLTAQHAKTSKRPLLLRHVALAFWSLLPASRRAHGALRLLDGIKALAAAHRHEEEEEGAAVAGGGRTPLRKKKKKKKSKKGGGREEDEEDEMWVPMLPSLRCLTAEAGGGLLELLLLLSLCTLVLARPKTTKAPAGPYSEVRDALAAVAHIVRLAAHPSPYLLHTPHAMRRIEAAAIRTATTAAAMCQWQVDRCLTWRTTRSSEQQGDEEGEESAAVAHVTPLLQDAHGLARLLVQLSARAKARARQARGGGQGGGGGGGAEVHVPKCVLAGEKLCEALREAEAMLGLTEQEAGGTAGALLARERLRAMLAVVEEEQGGGARREEEGVEEVAVEEEELGSEEEEEEAEESEDLDESDEEEEDEDEEEDEFYALTTTLKGRKKAVQAKAAGGWGGVDLLGGGGAEEDDDEEEEEEEEEEGGLTRVVGLGGAAKYEHRVAKGGTLVVSLGAGSGGKKRPRWGL